MAKFKIEDNIPIPEKRQKIEVRPTYPFAEMKPGQSFLVKAKANKDKEKAASRLSSAIFNYRENHGRHFSFLVRSVEDGVRCYRLEDGKSKVWKKKMAEEAATISAQN